MPKIYDNIQNHLTTGLNEFLEHSLRADFCVGYFNLRGWKQVVDQIEGLTGAVPTLRGDEDQYRFCIILHKIMKFKHVALTIHFIYPKHFQKDN